MENESLRTEAEIAALQDAAMNAGVSENVQVAALMAVLLLQAPV